MRERRAPQGATARHGATTREGGHRRRDGTRRHAKAASKGNKAQGGQVDAHPQQCAPIRTIPRSKALRDSVLSGIGNIGAAGNGSVGTVGTGALVKSARATAVVTRCGCGMEESSGGYETRRGEAPIEVTGIGTTSNGRRRRGRQPPDRRRKRVEPHDRQRDATSPRVLRHFER
jgi:hypothetical protein